MIKHEYYFKDNMTNSVENSAELKHKTIEQGESILVFIGDIHGQYQKLVDLLNHLDFDHEDSNSNIEFMRIVFVGDIIDNKIEENIDQLACLQLVKLLVDKGLAYCIMGNHEFNAIGWATVDSHGQPLRKHSEQNRKQHEVFLAQVGNDIEQYQYWIDWFKRLPLFLDFGTIRAIHACWHSSSIKKLIPYLNSDNSLKANAFSTAFDKKSELYELIEILLKGPELQLPDGAFFYDKTNTKRTNIRLRWWLAGFDTYQHAAQVQLSMRSRIPAIPIEQSIQFDELTVPVVIGHYTLETYPSPLSNKVVCVDYNAAKGENPLITYSWYPQSEDENNQQYRDHEYNFDSTQIERNTMLDGLSSLVEAIIELQPDIEHIAYDKYIEQISNELWYEWDPIGINHIEACRDEYEGYTNIFAKLACYLSYAELSFYIASICRYQLSILSDNVDIKSQKLAYNLIKIAESYDFK